MTIDDLTIGDAKKLMALFAKNSGNTHSLEIGEKYIIRTVTYHYTGRLAEVTDSDIVLDDAAWIADSGRWAEALETGELSEVEPFPGSVIIARGAIVDASRWSQDLPRTTK